MKVGAIGQRVVNNYKLLSDLCKVDNAEENIVSIWGLSYKKGSGFINQLGHIERGRIEITLNKNNKINLVKKPSWITWNYALRKINSMLENTISNLDNPNIVIKRIINIFCFPQKVIEKLNGLASKK